MLVKGDSIKQFSQQNIIVMDNYEHLFTFGAILPTGCYSTIIFVDNIPVKFDNNNMLLKWEPKNNTLNYQSFNLNLEKGVHQIYSITLFLGDGGESQDIKFYESWKIRLDVK